jgi:hypothetical protein
MPVSHSHLLHNTAFALSCYSISLWTNGELVCNRDQTAVMMLALTPDNMSKPKEAEVAWAVYRQAVLSTQESHEFHSSVQFRARAVCGLSPYPLEGGYSRLGSHRMHYNRLEYLANIAQSDLIENIRSGGSNLSEHPRFARSQSARNESITLLYWQGGVRGTRYGFH